jgi:CheY-like chemotaxis protein
MRDDSISILLVDDEPDVLDMMTVMLRDDGYRLATALGGQQAVELARGEHFDVVVTDLKMPGMDGIATAAALKRMLPDADVIIATGFASSETLAACEGSGASAYIQKPFTRAELRTVLHQTLANRGRTRGGA